MGLIEWARGLAVVAALGVYLRLMKGSFLILGLGAAALLAASTHRVTAPQSYDLVINHITVVDVETGQLRPN